MWSCGRDYCPHIHDKKCLGGRVNDMIPYTIFPQRTIDSFTNVHIRCTNMYKSSIPTLAYENYTRQQKQPIEDDRNFVKDYYLQNCGDNSETMCNTIAEDLKEDMGTRSAYVKAGQENIKFKQQRQKKKIYLENARRRAITRYNDYFQKLESEKQTNRDQNSKWLQKLYRKLQQVAKHIVQGQGESVGDRQKMFLLSKANLSASYLSQIKVKNPKVAFEILEQIRTLMLKKKLKYEDQRQQQQHNVSLSVSYASQTTNNTSQGSMMSQATSMNESRADGEQQAISKYCDFQTLKKRWRIQDVQDVKQMIRRILTRTIVSQAEVTAVKKRKQAQKINQSLASKKKSLPKSTQKPKPIKKQKFQHKPKSNVNIIQQFNKQQLNKEQKQAKQALIKGGQFDAVGQLYQRNRNFSQIFKKKQQQILTKFTFKDSSISLNRDSLRQH